MFFLGIPSPNLQWKFQDQILDFKGPSLTLTSLSSENEGTYNCMAVNEYGSDSISFKLDVAEPPKFIEAPENLEVESHGTVRFPCELDIDERLEKQTKIEWFFNDTLIKTPKDHELVLNEVTKVHDGSYTCQVTSPFGSVNMTATLTVLGEPPSFISTGMFICE